MSVALSPAFLRVTIANFFFFLNFASFFLLPLYIAQLGGSAATVGVVMGLTGGASLLFMVVVGALIDRYGRRRFLLVGTAGMALAALGFTQVDSIGPLLFGLRLAQGLSFSCAFTATTTYAAALAPLESRARALGIFGLSTLLTHAIAPTLGEEIIGRFGFQALFAVAAGCTLVTLGLAMGLPGDGDVRVASVGGGRFSVAQWQVALITTAAAMGFGTVMNFIAVFVQSADLGRVGAFFAAYTSTAVLTRFVGAGASDRFGRHAVVIPALMTLGVSIALIATTHDLSMLVLAGMVFGAAQGISYPTLHALMVDLTGSEQLGRVQALFNGAFNLGVTTGAFLFGYVAELFGYRAMFLLAACMPVVGSIGLALVRRQQRRAR